MKSKATPKPKKTTEATPQVTKTEQSHSLLKDGSSVPVTIKAFRWLCIGLLVLYVYITTFVAPARNQAARDLLEMMMEIRRVLDRYAFVYLHVVLKYVCALGAIGLVWDPLIFIPFLYYVLMRIWTFHSVGAQVVYCQGQRSKIWSELLQSLLNWIKGTTGYPFYENLIEEKYPTIDLTSWSEDICQFFRLFSIPNPAVPNPTLTYKYQYLETQPQWLDGVKRIDFSINGAFFELVITIMFVLVFSHYMNSRRH